MSKRKAPAQRARPKDIAAGIAARKSLDHVRIARTSRQAVKAADRLLKEMDEVLRNLERKR